MTPSPHGALQTITLWRPNMPRLLLVLAGSSSVAALVIAGLALGNGASLANTLIAVALATLILAAALFFVLIVLADKQQPGFLTRRAHVVELSAHGVVLRGPAAELLGEQSAGTLRVARVNFQYGRMMYGGLELQYRSGSQPITRHQALSPWSGLPAQMLRGFWPLDDRTFDELVRYAGSV